MSLEFKELTSILTVPGTSAFLISRGQHSDGIKELWISVESSYKFHRLSIDFLPSLKYVMASDKGILCRSGTGEFKYICNPVSRSWIELPACIELTWWDFYGFSFDPCTRCCFLIAGINTREGKATVMEIYDFHQNEWTEFKASTNECHRPLSEGTYSEGKFYWLNEVKGFGNCCCAVLDVQKREWDIIEVPKHISRDAFDFIDNRRLTCWEGLIVLMDQKAFRLWELYTKDGREVEWYPLEILSKDQEVRRLRKSERSKMFTKTEIRMNESDCVSVISPSNHVVAV